MTQFIYDGTYTGLFCAIFEVYERRCADAQIIHKNKLTALSFSDNIEVYSDTEKAERVLNGLKKKLSTNALADIYRCHLSEINGIENVILRFVQYAFASLVNIEKDFGNADVLDLAQTVRKVGREKHRFEAFVRFESIGERFFYAPIDPDYNVLPLIAPHFMKRYADQSWIIYDTKRKYGIHYDCVSGQINEAVIDFTINQTDVSPTGIVFDPDEKLYAGLWKNYFKSVNIPMRKNTKLHLQHLPKRYWKYLVEKQ